MRKLLLLSILLCGASLLQAQNFYEDHFQEKTLRVDYIFSGTDKTCDIALSELKTLDGWAGRRVNMTQVPLRGNGQLLMTDAASGDTLYRMSFCTLFQLSLIHI